MSPVIPILFGLSAVALLVIAALFFFALRRDQAVDDDMDMDEGDAGAFMAQTDTTHASRAFLDAEIDRAVELITGDVQGDQTLDLGTVILTRAGLWTRILGDIAITPAAVKMLHPLPAASGLPQLDQIAAKPGLESLNHVLPVTELPAPGLEIPWSDVLGADVIERTNVNVRFRLNPTLLDAYRRKLAEFTGQSDVPESAVSPKQALLFAFDEGRHAFLMVKVIARLAGR